jgi:hypothetical protein
MRVLLERMPHRENRLFPDERRPRALQRAQTLADLHGCKFTEDSENAAIIVHAAEWYAPKVGDRLKMYPGNDPEGGPKQWHTWTGTSWQSDEEKEMIIAMQGMIGPPPPPFNRGTHDQLVALGYVRTHYPESFEDDGDAESGPHLTGGPAYDEYESADDRVIIDHNGHFAHHEKRDLEWEAHCDAMYQAEQTHARL